MFNFLKEKLKSALSKFSRDVDEEAEEVVETPKKPEQKEEKPVQKKEEKPKPKIEEKQVQKKEEKKPEPKKEEKPVAKKVEKKEIPPPVIEEKKPIIPEAEVEQPKLPTPPQEYVTKKLSAELVGIKETLEDYSEADIDSILETIGAPKQSYAGKKTAEKIELILEKPIADIQSALDEFENPKIEEEMKEIEEEAKEELEEEKEEEAPKKEGFFKKLFGFGKKKEEKEEEEKEEEPEKEEAIEQPPKLEKVKEPKKEQEPETLDYISKEIKKKEEDLVEDEKEIEEEEKETEEDEKVVEEEKKGFFGKLAEGFTLKTLSESKFESIFFELEVALLENNVAVEVIEKIKQDLKKELVDKKLKRGDIDKIIGKTLVSSISEILSTPQINLLDRIKQKRKENQPCVIIFVGINGSGKTTTIAKMAKYFINNGLKTVMVAADTFRAAAIQQLEEHANNLGVKIIKHDYGSDPAAVAFDGIKYAEAKGIDVVLIDTAGRLHSNTNLMDEMKKVIRVAKPDIKIFIGESITGNDCIEQAQAFNAAIDIDGIVLSKADVDEKGGAAISVSYVTGKPILFIGTGQTYESLEKFDKKLVLENLGLG